MVQDVDRPHILKGKRIKIFALKRKVVIIILTVMLLSAAAIGGLIWYNSGIRLAKADYYILSLDTQSSLDSAETSSKEIINGGGGGYILNDGQFKITAAAYKTASDAETVRSRMSERFLSAQVIDAGIKKSKLKGFDRKSNKEIKKILQYPVEFLDYILAQNLKLDAFETTESAVLLLLSGQTETLNSNKKKLEELLRSYPASIELNNAYEFYKTMQTAWDETISTTSADGTLTHRLKYFSCKHIHLYRELRKFG